MKRFFSLSASVLLLLFTLTGCARIGDKSANLSVIYIIATVISCIVLLVYCLIVKKRDIWFLLLFSMIVVVNTGYLALSVSTTLEEALLANRISYLGSVFLPLSMLFIILNVCTYKYKKWLPILLGAISMAMFLIAASPGYSDIYYKDVSLVTVNGVAMLDKVYGPWHPLYLFYLVFYFSSMIICTAIAAVKRQFSATRQAIVITVAVTVNIGVWLIEQLVKIDFEFLSVSYIISELFLLSLCFMLRDEQKQPGTPSEPPSPYESTGEKALPTEEEPKKDDILLLKGDFFLAHIKTLTPTEKTIFSLYLEGKNTKEIMTELNIKENTLKYHNKNIYGKLGVSSRRQMLELASKLDFRLR